jgi:alkanesulfonate monooxygenase SsuD/methylene tetrahydromethanopterin reductase-like flavin-dependent oxidoreductase (luciferase family)
VALTEFGIWVSRGLLGGEGSEAARLLEELGFGALWVGGSPRLSDLRPLLEATETLTVATSIANIWRYGAVRSRRLIDAVVPQGSPEQIATAARAHLAAGADHVALQPVSTGGVPSAEWTALAAALIA